MTICNDLDTEKKQTTAEASETTGHNPVLDGSFPDGSIAMRDRNSRTSSWHSEDWQFTHYAPPGESTYVGLWKKQRIWQDIVLPVQANGAAEGRPDYWLSCEYDATIFDECTLSVYRLDGEEEKESLYQQPMRGQPLPPGEDEDYVYPGQVPAKVDPTWHTLTSTRIAVPANAERIRVVFETPDAIGGSYLYLRSTLSLVRLPAFSSNSEVRLVVDPEGANLNQSTQPFMLCHGAAHSLQVKAPAGDAWLEQKLSLLWLNTDGRLPVEYGLTTVPEFNLDDGDQEDRYQPLSAETGANWVLTAAGTANTPSGDVLLGLGSYWQAQKHSLQAQVGDFRFDVTTVSWDGVVPTIDLGNSTVLTATLKSPFDDSRVVREKEVVWLLNDKEYRRVPTGANGKSVLEYKPRSGEEGADNRVKFTAVCADAFGQETRKEQTISVFAGNPWPKELDILLNGRPITEFNVPSLHLTSEGPHTLTLKPKNKESYFNGKPITLQWPGTESPPLDITFTPTAAQTMAEEGISWTITGGSKKGLFTLETVEAGLSVPFSLKGMQVSGNLADEIQVTLDGKALSMPAMFYYPAEQRINIVPNSDSPLRDAGLDCWMSFIPDSLGEEGMPTWPVYNNRYPLRPDGLSWTTRQGHTSGTFKLAINVDSFPEPLRVEGVLLSSNLKDEVDFYLDGHPWSNTHVFRRGTPAVLTVVPKEESPLRDVRFDGWIEGRDAEVPESSVSVSPSYRVKQPSTVEGWSWTLTGGDDSGLFGLEFHLDRELLQPLRLPSLVLLSTDLRDDAIVLRGNTEIHEKPVLYFKRGQPLDFRLSAGRRGGALMRNSQLRFWVEFVKTDELDAGQVSVSPDYRVEQAMKDGEVPWTFEAGNVSGMFTLKLHATGYTTPLTLQAALISSNLNDEVTVTVNNRPPKDPEEFPVNQPVRVGFLPRTGSPMAKLEDPGMEGRIERHRLSGGAAIATPNWDTRHPAAPNGMTWSIDPYERSKFDIKISVSEFDDYWLRNWEA